MKILYKITKTVFFVLLAFALLVFVTITVLKSNIRSDYKISKGETLHIKSIVPLTAFFRDEKSVDAASDNLNEKYEVDLKLFGVIPFSTVNVEVIDRDYVCVLGQPFGMRIYTDGVLVVNTKNITIDKSEINPARIAGIKVGDYILSVNGKSVTNNEELSEIVTSSNGNKLYFEMTRDNKKFYCYVKPVIDSQDGQYHIGILVRDSSAGIGTLTFYSPTDNVICGLGHGLNDQDTNELIRIEKGQMVSAEIMSVEKGEKGKPGELGGRFTNETLANIEYNGKDGVYGSGLADIKCANLTKVALKQEIKSGKAQILCTVEGDAPKLYSCNIKVISEGIFSSETKIKVTVTDKTLLSKTGGIVQGMSGSPIIQNGKLIGAITHVLVDDPTTGYAIFAENMLETAESVASENKLKEAS